VIGIDAVTGAQKFRVPMPDEAVPNGDGIVAGDGYFYTTYGLRVSHLPEGQFTETIYVHVLRIASNGSYNDMPLLEWSCAFEEVPWIPGPTLITNADTGAVLTWEGDQAQRYWATMAMVDAGGLSHEGARGFNGWCRCGSGAASPGWLVRGIGIGR
jgi:hypothetical protein